MIPWNEIRRFATFRRSLGYDEEQALPIECSGRPQRDLLMTLRRTIYATCLVARDVIRQAGVSLDSPRGASIPPLLIANVDEARQTFDAAFRRKAPSMDDLTAAFLPTALLYGSEQPEGGAAFLGFRDETASSERMTGLVAAGDAAGPRHYRALGDVFFLPPALRGEGRARNRWVHTERVDPPYHHERGGPYWRLGKWNLWRLEVLAWHERLLLAAQVAARSPVAVALGPQNMFPRIGFVSQAATSMGRTMIGVPIEACPTELQEALAESSAREFTGLDKLLRTLREVL